jgi:hypothetical protein
MKLPLVTRSTVENFDCEEVDVVMICASLSVGRTVLIPVLRLSRPPRQLCQDLFCGDSYCAADSMPEIPMGLAALRKQISVFSIAG